MTRDEFIKHIIENDITIAKAKQLISSYYDTNSDIYVELSRINIQDILDYNKELLLEYPDQKWNEYCDFTISRCATKSVNYFSTVYDSNNSITFRQLVSFYIKNYKFMIPNQKNS